MNKYSTNNTGKNDIMPSGGPGGGRGGFRPKEKPKHIWKTMIRFLHYLGGNPIKLLFAIVMVILSSLTGIIAIWYLKPLINGMKEGVTNGKIVASLVVMAAIYVTSAVLSYISNLIMVQLAQSTSNRIRKELFDHVIDLPVNYFDTKTHGEVMSRFTNDVDNINIALEQSLSQTINSTITVVGVFIMMLLLSPFLTIFTVLFFFLMLWIIKIIGSKSSIYFRAQQKAMGELNGIIEEMMEGQKVVKVFQRERKVVKDFREKNRNYQKAATQAQTYAGILMPIMGNLSYAHYAVTVMIGAAMVIGGRLDIGTIAAFLTYTRSFSMPITQIANQFNTLLSGLAGAERIFDVLDSPVEENTGQVRLRKWDEIEAYKRKQETIKEPFIKWYWEIRDSGGERSYIPLCGDIRLNDVTFGYIMDRKVLRSVSLYAKPGQKIAFVGSTGAGKTTITNLINRFYEIEEGQITFDGIDIKQINKSDLRRSLGMILQEVHLFQGTIRDNIRYGNLEATEDDIIYAAKLANAHSFIMKLPKGYDTVLSPDGLNLSQGQRQLLSIARAAVADPPILILDEATSSVDTHTEKLIELGMDQLMHGRTTLAIAHRLSTVRNANAIMVLEQGEIIERGDHNNLLELKGRYHQLYTGAIELD